MGKRRKIKEKPVWVLGFKFFLIFYIRCLLFGEKNVVFLLVNYSNLE